jgi:hypothetical protein
MRAANEALRIGGPTLQFGAFDVLEERRELTCPLAQRIPDESPGVHRHHDEAFRHEASCLVNRVRAERTSGDNFSFSITESAMYERTHNHAMASASARRAGAGA